jgi:1-acyl-sn-glycerol-3-phosphate acyltransferase
MKKTTKQGKKRQPWIKKRHVLITNIAKAVLKPYINLKYHAKFEKFKDQGDRQYLILANHQTGFDQFFVAYCFKGAVYYVASEDIFSMGFISDLLRFAVNPIPIKKQTTDISAVLNCLRVVKEGGNIAIFPEGNRTYSGKTEYIKPSIVGLAKILKMPIAIFRIEGGYGVHPRWSDVVRKGKMRAYVSKVIEPEEYLTLSDDALYERIKEELYVDENALEGEFYHKKLAEYLERAVYYCPTCGFSEFESQKDVITCKKCGLTARYTPNKKLVGVDCKFPYSCVNEWYEAQNEFVAKADLSPYMETPLYEDEVTRFLEVTPGEKRTKLANKAKLSLYGDKAVVQTDKENYTFFFHEVSVLTVLGRNKLNVYFQGKVYQIKGTERFNALKYVNVCYRAKSIEKGESYAKFLGI